MNDKVITIKCWNITQGWSCTDEYNITSIDLQDGRKTRTNALLFSEILEDMIVEFKVNDKKKVFDLVKSDVIPLSKFEEIKKESDSIYIFNQNVTMYESKQIEFKSFSNSFLPTDDSKRIIEKYTVAFMNSIKGGSLFIGIENDGQIVGTKLNFNSSREQRDSISLTIDKIMKGCEPALDSGVNYDVFFHPLYKTKFEGYKVMRDRWIIEVRIYSHTNPYVYQTSGKYDNSSTNIAYLRQEASVTVMSPNMIANRTVYYHKQLITQQAVVEDENHQLINLVQQKIGLEDIQIIKDAIISLTNKNNELTLNNVVAEIFG